MVLVIILDIRSTGEMEPHSMIVQMLQMVLVILTVRLVVGLLSLLLQVIMEEQLSLIQRRIMFLMGQILLLR